MSKINSLATKNGETRSLGITIYFITSNKDKFLEAQLIIPELAQLNINLDEIQDNNPRKIIAYKLEQAQKHHHGSFIVEDTSLYFHCLNKTLPGPFIKYFIKAIGNNGLYALCKKFNDYRAVVKTIIGYYDAIPKENIFFEGSLKGSIVNPIGTYGFGWDMIFLADGYSHTFAQMTRKEKTSVSMRTLGFEKLKKHFTKND
ncbi:MAG TPA: non-canonical purine NTP pyrophosphatase [Patescibacteria group bacterium]|nr:non-canonical purine NTP pyrophosphatase [Patescibacteria group bacterium]